MENAERSDISGSEQMHEYHICFFLEFDLPAITIINLLQLIIGFWAYLGNFASGFSFKTPRPTDLPTDLCT